MVKKTKKKEREKEKKQINIEFFQLEKKKGLGGICRKRKRIGCRAVAFQKQF